MSTFDVEVLCGDGSVKVEVFVSVYKIIMIIVLKIAGFVFLRGLDMKRM